jgi:SAM-dependent methyltransferase
MSGFSPEWLSLREGVDHRSRDARLAGKLALYFAGRDQLRIVDLGAGTGSNLRATAPLLDAMQQQWTLVDYDPALIEAAERALTAWADRTERVRELLVVHARGRRIEVRFREADLEAGLEDVLGAGPDLVTASALFDLCSPDFIDRFAGAVARHKAAFYTVLTYNGEQAWTPAHTADAGMLAAFTAHQRTDKGFGVSAGPDAPAALAGAFRSLGYRVSEGNSPWLLGEADRRLIAELAEGFAAAVDETGRFDAATLGAWTAVTRTAAVVGHTDTLALPAL